MVPLLVTAGCFGVFLPSDAAFPWTRGERVVGLAILDYALVTYHFAAQHFGALSLYRARVGRGACAHTRRMDRIFGALVTGLRTSSWAPALLALGFATAFLHYLLDRDVYRLSDPQVRSAARGLLTPPARGRS